MGGRIYTLVCVLVAVGFIFYLAASGTDCRARGGVLVRGMVGVECVNARR